MKENKVLNEVTKSLRKSQACILALEEISELITEFSNILEKTGNVEDLCEEIADVEIMSSLIMNTFTIKRKTIDKEKEKMRKDHKQYCDACSERKILNSCIWELANLQKVICKKGRGRHNKKDIIDAIVGVELSIEYLCHKKMIEEKDIIKWRHLKIKRMQKRVRKHQIV